MSADQFEQECIAKLAYLRWESRGRPAGSAEQDWLEAEMLYAAGNAANTPQAEGSVGLVPTLDAPVKVKTEMATTERRKSRFKTATVSREAEGPDFL